MGTEISAHIESRARNVHITFRIPRSESASHNGHEMTVPHDGLAMTFNHGTVVACPLTEAQLRCL
jgi:hypothetical protein